jgi:aerobic carbon-monoxide dehydrogenase medium subunit
VKPAPFDYVRADSVEHAVTRLAAANGDGEGKIIAGGQSLMPLLALRLAQPSVLVDINRVPGLDAISPRPGGGLRIGALTRHRALAAQDEHPLLAEAARWVGHAAIRTRGTLGGSLAHADPAAELPVVAVAAGAAATVAGPGGRREIPAGDLFTAALQTSLDDDELIESVEFPALGRWGFAEFARRNGDFGLVIVAYAEIRGRPRLALGGVAASPVRPAAAEAILADGPLTTPRIGAAAAAAAGEIEPASDIHASAGYRRQLTRVLVARALAQAAQEEEPCR